MENAKVAWRARNGKLRNAEQNHYTLPEPHTTTATELEYWEASIQYQCQRTIHTGPNESPCHQRMRRIPVARRRQVSSPKYVTFVQLLLGNHVRAVINGTLTPSSQIFVRFFFSHFPLPRATSRHSGRFLYCTLFTTSFLNI
jgi:hypothetical protein